jgi:hypothetical protein
MSSERQDQLEYGIFHTNLEELMEHIDPIESPVRYAMLKWVDNFNETFHASTHEPAIPEDIRQMCEDAAGCADVIAQHEILAQALQMYRQMHERFTSLYHSLTVGRRERNVEEAHEYV